jgi:hypothetical protein
LLVRLFEYGIGEEGLKIDNMYTTLVMTNVTTMNFRNLNTALGRDCGIELEDVGRSDSPGLECRLISPMMVVKHSWVNIKERERERDIHARHIRFSF